MNKVVRILQNIAKFKKFECENGMKDRCLKIFEFDENRFKNRYFDVANEVIDCFNYCESVDLFEKIGYGKKRLKDLKLIKEILESEDKNLKKDNCLDLLGVYKDCEVEKNIIFLAGEKIKKVAKEYNISFEKLYEFVKAHEIAHGLMSPFAYGYNKIRSKKSIYILVEEALANAYALKKFSSDSEFDKLKYFVKTQPIQYRLGLDIYEKFENEIELLMLEWRFEKIKVKSVSFNINNFVSILFDEKEIKLEDRELRGYWDYDMMIIKGLEIALLKRIYSLYEKKIGNLENLLIKLIEVDPILNEDIINDIISLVELVNSDLGRELYIKFHEELFERILNGY